MSVSSRNGTAIAVKMMIPPIVGVPALAWCPSGPSSRMFCPNSRSRRNEMNFGDRKMQISSEAVPAIRTSPTGRAPPRPSPGPIPRDAFTSTMSPGATSPSASAAASPASAATWTSPPKVSDMRGDSGPTVDQHVNAGRRRVRADLPVRLRLAGPSSSMSPSTATRRPAGACVARSSSAARMDSGLAL